MTPEEEKYQEELKASGVELPEQQKAEADAKATEEAEAQAKAEAEAKAKANADAAHLQEKTPNENGPETPTKPRSIYQDYKDKKLEAKTAIERAEQAEKERDEFKQLLAAATASKGSDTEAAEDALAYAKKVGADPELVQRIIADARKGIKPEIDENLRKDLDDFKAFKASNAKAIEQQMFNDEFDRTLPDLKKLFPSLDEESTKAVRSELDRLSHTKDWHDKSLDYIAFKHQDALSTLVSPKKRGMENKGRQDAEAISQEFDPAADYSKMTPKQREAWEAQYRSATKAEGLVEDAQGRKLIV